LSAELLTQTTNIFVAGLQLAAPQMAVAFIILLIFSALGRAIPQMSVFRESLSVRPLVGLSVFGVTMQLTSQHIINYMRHLPNDMLRVAQLLGTH
jgi:flagellar biosynthesis protein FliR